MCSVTIYIFTVAKEMEDLLQSLPCPSYLSVTQQLELEEFKFDLERAVDDIAYYKRTVMRSKISTDLWEELFNRKDPQLVLATSDFAMKLLPRSGFF